ncbi:MAG: Tm-1-like ATP-binding domain-containing protein [Desulfarculaceae bacterium]|nr:Tm-1-like ATP-binding domain-containing protein [Desulfarculaceae bacterium]
MSAAILLISTLDTKAQETRYLRQRMERGGAEVLLMDLSMGAASDESCEIPPSEVAAAAGWKIEDIRASRERAKITAAMIQGAVNIASERFAGGRLDAVVGLGGSTGSLMATEVMRALPFGLPKLMISSTAALPGLATRYIDTGDLLLFHTVVEIAGLSPLLTSVLDRAAAAALALAKVPVINPEAVGGQGLVAMSMFGPCERCAHQVRLKLEEKGFQVIGFSAAGVCDRAMEDMIAQGYFAGVVDLAPGGVGEHLLGGMRSAGPHRLEAAGKRGIPQVIAPSGVNLMSPRKSRYKPDYHQRRKYDLDKLRTFLRLDPEELREVAQAFADKLNQAQGPVTVLVPTQGWCSFDREGGSVFAPEEDRIFTQELRARLKPGVTLREVDANLEDDAFGDAVEEAFLDLLPPVEVGLEA